MATCRKCGNKIPAWKLIFLTNFNTITCPTCLARLQANKKINGRIGGIGGGVGGGIGALLLGSWFQTKEVCFLILFIALLILIFFASWLAEMKFMKLEVKSQHV